jgi:hypothetical protein
VEQERLAQALLQVLAQLAVEVPVLRLPMSELAPQLQFGLQQVL